MWQRIYVLALLGIYSTQSNAVDISPHQSVFSVAQGSNLQVNCSSPNGVQWEPAPQNAMNEGRVTKSGDNVSTLTLENVQETDEGTYRCRDKTTREDITFELFVFSVITQESEFEYKEDAMLHCSVNDSTKTYTYSWMKGATPVGQIKIESKQEYVEHENGSLQIKSPSRSVAGLYTCIAKYEDTDGTKRNISIEVNYFATPFVLPFDKSKNLVQDEKLTIECQVLGYPKPTITWFKGDEVIKPAESSRYKLSPAETYGEELIDNGKLEIDTVDFDDGGEYNCMASHSKWPEFNSTQPILVRVKDKLAALWPFLGIVAEVVILCTIIFIYEKKRNKDAAEEDDPNQHGDTPEKKSEGVRHRGNPNNPRA